MAMGPTVDQGALSRSVGGEHSAHGCPVPCRGVRRPEQTEGSDFVVETIGDHPGLDHRGPGHGIDGDDSMEMAFGVDHESVAQALAVGTGPASPGHDRGRRRLGTALHDQLDHVGPTPRGGHTARPPLVDRVVGGVHDPSTDATIHGHGAAT